MRIIWHFSPIAEVTIALFFILTKKKMEKQVYEEEYNKEENLQEDAFDKLPINEILKI